MSARIASGVSFALNPFGSTVSVASAAASSSSATVSANVVVGAAAVFCVLDLQEGVRDSPTFVLVN